METTALSPIIKLIIRYSNEKQAPGIGTRGLRNGLRQCGDIFCLGTLLALRDSKFNFLAFQEGLEAGTLDSTEVSENVRTGLLLNKTETLGFVKPLNFASYFRHNTSYQYKKTVKPFRDNT